MAELTLLQRVEVRDLRRRGEGGRGGGGGKEEEGWEKMDDTLPLACNGWPS